MLTRFQEQFIAARRASTPLVVVRNSDNASALSSIHGAIKESDPIIVWDCVTGFQDATASAKQKIASICQQQSIEASLDLVNALSMIRAYSERQSEDDLVVCLYNIHLLWSESPIIQAIWNLRESFKRVGNTLVLMTNQGAIAPNELSSDVLVLDEPLPDSISLTRLIKRVIESAGLPEQTPETIQKCLDALNGLAAFPAEQSLAMSISRKDQTINFAELWERKKQAINATNGLSVWEGKQSLAMVAGLDNVKGYLTAIMEGNDSPKTILYLDEIEKTVAGSGTDTSGVKTELVGQMLRWTQDKDMSGVLFIGVPGGGKSELAKALGLTYGIPTINFDLAGMQHSHVGQSGANLRTAIATVDAISSGRVLLIATCNSIDALSPELRRRFKDGTFFFDAPSEVERAAIWKLYRDKYSIPVDDPTPVDHGWTGAEIKECCSKAYRLRLPLSKAATYIVPVTVSSHDIIERLRSNSSGKFLSASNPGMYVHAQSAQLSQSSVEASGSRRIRD